MSPTLQIKMYAGFFALLLMMIGLSALSTHQTKELTESQSWLLNDQQSIQALQELFSSLKDAETGQRGYLLTGEERYLAPYRASRAVVSGELKTLETFLHSHPHPHPELSALSSLIRDRFAELQQTLDVRKASGFDAAMKIVRTDRGQAIMEKIRGLIGRLSARETVYLNVHIQTVKVQSERTERIVLWANVAATLIVTLLLSMLGRDIHARERAEGKLKEAHDLLDARVRERTRQLEESNEHLLAEIRERERMVDLLRDSEERNRSVIDLLEEGIVLHDGEGKIVDCNPSAERILGLSNEQMLGRTSVDPRWGTVHEDGTHFPGEAHPAMVTLKTGRPVRNAVMGVRKMDGTLSWIAINSKPLHRPEADDRLIVASFADITRYKIANEQILRQLNQLSVLRQIDMAILSERDLGIEAKLRRCLEHLLEHLRVDAAAILLVDRDKAFMDYAAGEGFRTAEIRKTHLPIGHAVEGQSFLDSRNFHIPDLRLPGAGFVRTSLQSEEGFISYSGFPLVVKGEIRGVLELFHRKPLDPGRDWFDQIESLVGQIAIALDNALLLDALERSLTELSLTYDITMEGWVRALDLRDQETEGHTQRVTQTCLRLAAQMGFTEAELVHIRRGALLHDIGKLGIPDRILLKEGPLTLEERTIIERHPGYAYEFLKGIEFLGPALEIPYCHHEKWDGTGYPRGLKGEEIPLAVRIFAVVDVWDALRSDRPYRAGWPEERVEEYLRRNAGSHFDPRAVEAFFRLMQ